MAFTSVHIRSPLIIDMMFQYFFLKLFPNVLGVSQKLNR